MASETTAADGDLATATPMASTPASSGALGGYVGALVNGVEYTVGDGTKVGADCYFSGNGGATARLLRQVAAGDLLYWQGSVAGFELDAATDVVDFLYEVAP